MNILLFENFQSKTLICVDIQPTYRVYITFDVPRFFSFLNKAVKEYGRVIYLYNGPELDCDSLDDLQYWMVGNGFDNDELANIEFFDKGYGWFRACLDPGYTEAVTKLLKYMVENNIDNANDIKDEAWAELEKGDSDVSDVKEICKGGDPLYLPDLVDFIKDKATEPIDCVGGGEEQCLKEVEIILDVLDKEYQRINKWTY